MTVLPAIRMRAPLTPGGEVECWTELRAGPVALVSLGWDGPFGGMGFAYAQIGPVPAVMWMFRLPGDDR